MQFSCASYYIPEYFEGFKRETARCLTFIPLLNIVSGALWSYIQKMSVHRYAQGFVTHELKPYIIFLSQYDLLMFYACAGARGRVPPNHGTATCRTAESIFSSLDYFYHRFLPPPPGR